MKPLLSKCKWDKASGIWERRVHYNPKEGEPGEPEVSHAYCWIPPFHWYETPSHFCLEWDIPGLTPDDLEFVVEGRTLVIQEKQALPSSWEPGKKRNTAPKFAQRIRLPKYIEPHKGEALYKDDKLTIFFPKASQALGNRLKATWLSFTQALSNNPVGSSYRYQ